MDEKKWYMSKGVNGSIGAIGTSVSLIVIVVLKFFGVDASNEATNITALVVSIIGVVMGIVALIGRLKANSRIIK
jgi:fumarate reductase subunit D